MKKTKNNHPVPGFFNAPNLSVVSSTECTGLFQGLPEDEEQADAYTDIYDIPEQEGLEALTDVKHKGA